MADEKPRCGLKVIYSCFDCFYFVNRSSNIDIKKERYQCMVEKREFSFQEMSPDGMPKWCPLPFMKEIMKDEKAYQPFGEVFMKLEKSKREK